MIYSICLNPVIQKTILKDCIEKGSVNRASFTRWDASGKGINVSRVLVQSGFPVCHITFVRGMHKKWFSQMASLDNIPLVAVDLHSSSDDLYDGIRFCTTIIEQNPYAVTEIVEEGLPVSEDDSVYISAVINDTIFNEQSDCKVLVLSGSKAPGFSNNTFAHLVSRAISLGIHVIADYRGEDLAETLTLYKKTVSSIADSKTPGVLIIKPNVQELKDTLPFLLPPSDSSVPLCETVLQICREYRCAAVITNGVKNTLASCSQQCIEIPVPLVEESKAVCNTTGCGDAFTAGIASHLVQKPLKSSELDLNDLTQLLPNAFEFAAANAVTIRPGSLY